MMIMRTYMHSTMSFSNSFIDTITLPEYAALGLRLAFLPVKYNTVSFSQLHVCIVCMWEYTIRLFSIPPICGSAA